MRKELVGWKFIKDTDAPIYPKMRLALNVLKENGGEMPLKDIAVKMRYSGTPATFKAVTISLYRLRKKGLVQAVLRDVEGPVKKEMRELCESSKAVQTWMKRLNSEGTKGKFLFLFARYFQWVKTNGFFKTPDAMLDNKQDANNDKDRSKHLSMIEDYLLETKLALPQQKSTYTAIRSFYKHNKSALPPYPIQFKNGSLHVVTQEPITLDEIRQLLLAAKVRERAMFLIMMQGGLDRSTFARCFNTEAWPQICKQLGNENPENWDFSRAPIRIDLIRVKTNNQYYTFLSVDALKALQAWMNIREGLTGEPMRNGEAIFLTTRREPITETMLSDLFHRAAIHAGLEPQKYGKAQEVRYRFHAHELRDTFRSAATMAGVAPPVAEWFIGHQIDKMHYDKSPKVYPDHFRAEFMKMEQYLNVESSQAVGLKKMQEQEEEIEELRGENQELRKQLDEQKNTHEAEWVKFQQSMKERMDNELNKFKRELLLERVQNKTKMRNEKELDEAAFTKE